MLILLKGSGQHVAMHLPTRSSMIAEKILVRMGLVSTPYSCWVMEDAFLYSGLLIRYAYSGMRDAERGIMLYILCGTFSFI